MATIRLPPDFKEFLKLLNEHEVKYLLIGGYAVSYYGYPRSTGDMDIWIALHPQNATKLVQVLQNFGFAVPGLSADLFLQEGQIVRMGVPPLRIELLNTISGVAFEECYARRQINEIDGILVNLIHVQDLKLNKQASGRPKDLNDLENLP